MGEEQDEVEQQIVYSYKITVLRPPFVIVEWGKAGKGVGGRFSRASIENSPYVQFDKFENLIDLAAFT